ncbi:MAG: M23 family metallopeptidase [Clostridia bacterium]|nr:M23 family metallopeptidase [Clostridia bacterium]
MKGFFARLRLKYEDFMERQGFYWLCGVCAAVIVFTALWTQQSTSLVAPQPPARQASDSQDETLAQVIKTPLLPEPTQEPLTFSRPLSGKAARAFSASSPVYFEHTGHWQLHAACDYEASVGEVVKAIAEGTVLSSDNSQVVIQHSQGYESRYLGLASAPYVQPGDPVAAGQTIGHAGQGPLWEQAEGAHLHLEVFKNGSPLDPESLWD